MNFKRTILTAALLVAAVPAFAQTAPPTTVSNCHAEAPATTASGAGAFATGCGASADGDTASAIGNGATASGSQSIAVGPATASGTFSVAIGVGANAQGYASTAIGDAASASANQSAAFGASATASGEASQAIGARADASGSQALASGYMSNAAGLAAVASGSSANAAGDFSVAHGALSSATAANSVALGAHSVADEEDTVSVGNATRKRRVVNLADGSLASDAATVNQLNMTASGFGGGAGFVNGMWQAPNYRYLSGATYNNVESALYDLDGRLTTLENAPSTGGGTPGPAGPQGATGATGATGAAGRDGATGATGPQGIAGNDGRNGVDGAAGVGGDDPYFDAQGNPINQGLDTARALATDSVAAGPAAIAANRGSVAIGPAAQALADDAVAIGRSSVADEANTVSVGSVGNERRITNVARAVHRTDAPNWGQVQDLVGSAENRWNDRWTTTNERIDRVEGRLNTMGAMSAAFTTMASAYNLAPGKVSAQAGVGVYNNKAAFAVGLRAMLSPRVGMVMGVSHSGSETMGGWGLSINLD